MDNIRKEFCVLLSRAIRHPVNHTYTKQSLASLLELVAKLYMFHTFFHLIALCGLKKAGDIFLCDSCSQPCSFLSVSSCLDQS